MLPAAYAISRTRTDVTLGFLLRGALFAGALAAALFAGIHPALTTLLLIVGLGAIAYRSAVGARLSADSPALIASGQFDEAERRIETAVRSFIPSRSAKVLNLYHLAVLRHAQRRYAETAQLTRAVLRLRARSVQGLAASSRLMLAESLLETGDLRAASQVIHDLHSLHLPLSDSIHLLVVELDLQSRRQAWTEMVRDLPRKAQLAELLPSDRSAKAQALLALASSHTGQPDWAQFLRRRAELLIDPPSLIARVPALSGLWLDSSDI